MDPTGPRKNSLCPKIKNGQDQDGQKNKHFQKRDDPARLWIVSGYGEQVKDIHFKGEEEEGVDIIIRPKANPGSPLRTHAALIGHTEIAPFGSGRKKNSHYEWHCGKKKTDNEENEDAQLKPVENHDLVLTWFALS
jgi:hypothetical protein